jgi:aspartate kinase
MLQKKTLVMKFGGTSVGSVEAMSAGINIVRVAKKEFSSVAVIVSALSGITNLLLENATKAASGDLSKLEESAERLYAGHGAIANALISDVQYRNETITDIDKLIDVFTDLCHAIWVLGEASPRALDAVASLGERMSARLFAAVLRSAGLESTCVEATELIITDYHYQNAHPDMSLTTERTRSTLLPLFERRIVPIITGFIGATPEGVVTTLGRGGSDYSAGIIGAALPADEVWIWTDVDGVMTADPRLVPDALTLPEITYGEIAELAYFGAKVLHPKTVRPVVDAGIGLRICNTFNPDFPGTRLVAKSIGNGGQADRRVVRAVTAIKSQKLVTIEGRGMLGVPGVAARAFGAVASTGTSVPLITQASSEQSICFAVPSDTASSVLSALEKVFASELEDNDIDRIWITEDISIITVVGAGMRSTPGVAGNVFGKLGKNGVNVLAIAQGSSEVSISMVVDSADTENAVKSLHELITQ